MSQTSLSTPAAPGDLAKLIGARIRAACRRRGWDAARLAQEAGISRTTLYHLEHGATERPRISTVSKVAAALEIPVERLWNPQPEEPPRLTAERNSATERDRQRQFDRVTNTTVDAVRRDSPELFADWSTEEWDELYSEFGTGGQLSREGVVVAAQRMNRKRQTIQQLHVVLETHLHDVATNVIETLYRMVQPPNDVTTTPQLAALLGPERLQSLS